MLFFEMCRAPHSYCLFVDGLDEIDSSDGGQFSLLELLQDLRDEIPGLKMCVSSRPQPILKE